ncbi:MAG: hypothetical protein H6738_17495 [Alphaproteobacteria bacterium]|nr:hypothetical protein [Alphaproteobacteria bacterium]MCB9698579.1 hypothetical protein [Alphaproteobacteria bacterium]
MSRDDSLRRRAARRLVDAAARLATRTRTAADDSRPASVADVLFMDSQHAAYVQLHRRFVERANAGVGGWTSALEALDAMWETVRLLRGGAPAVLLTLSSNERSVEERRSRFYVESTDLLEDAIRAVLAADLPQLVVPPERLAVLVRVTLEGLVVELAQARTPEDVARVDQAYLDLRMMFGRLVSEPVEAPDLELEPIPLPW